MVTGLACINICLTQQPWEQSCSRPTISSQYTCWFLFPILSLQDLSTFACWSVHFLQPLPWLCFRGPDYNSIREGIISVLSTPSAYAIGKGVAQSTVYTEIESGRWTSPSKRYFLSSFPGQSLATFMAQLLISLYEVFPYSMQPFPPNELILF